MKIFSKKNKNTLIAKIFYYKNLKRKRNDICPNNEFIQLSAQILEKGKIIRSHSHLNIKRKSNITQEIWLVFRGKIKASIFDINKKILKKVILSTGDCLILFRGGHGFKNISQNTVFYEIKNGPYFGKSKDTTEILNEL
jgi:cupin fold WbuC family metalloprotein